jgi:hypothetical protein
MAQDGGIELLVQQLLRRTLGLRRIGTEGLAHADSDPSRHRAKSISREEETLAVGHQRGMAARVTGVAITRRPATVSPSRTIRFTGTTGSLARLCTRPKSGFAGRSAGRLPAMMSASC